MKITQYTAAYFSIIWLAVDNEGHVLVADSAEGDVPSFVKENEERTERLSRLLLNMPAIGRNRNPAINFEALASRGFYCFQCDDYDGSVYRLVKRPERPLLETELCQEVKELLQFQKLPFCVDTITSFSFE